MGELKCEEEATNTEISSDRRIVENYFGRFCNKWNIPSSKQKWSAEFSDLVFSLCISMNNVHVELRPLREEDGQFYSQMKNSMESV